jgi:hypothetical protein
MVLMSAWIPAPPLESLPAIVNAVFIVAPFVFSTILYSGAGGAPDAPLC